MRKTSSYTQGPCPHKGCLSSDAYTVYDSGWAECYSCGERGFLDGENRMQEQNKEYRFVPERGLDLDTIKFYNILTEFQDGKRCETSFVYPNKAVKLRGPEKTFRSKGPMQEATLFGLDKFDSGSKPSVTITEGEYDAPSIYQATNGYTAAVSVPSSSQALKACKLAYDKLNGFDKIVLAFDNDAPGRKARDQVANLFDPKKVFVVDFDVHKDANDYLQAGEEGKLLQAWKGHHKNVPKGIVHSFADIKKALQRKGSEKLMDYPFQNLDEKLYGIHRGEFVLCKGLEGIGKTELFRALEYHALKTTKHNVGIIRLEECLDETIKGVATYELQAPAMMEEAGISDEEVMKAYSNAVGGKEDRLYIKSSFDDDDPDTILNDIRFLVVAGGCSIVFLDHLSMLVTGKEDSDERQKLDYVTRQLKKMAIQLGFALITIIHVNDNGQTRGSRYPAKAANTVINMERDVEHPDPVKRCQTSLSIQKGRGQGTKTGPAGAVWYDNQVSYTLKALEPSSDQLTDEEKGAFK